MSHQTTKVLIDTAKQMATLIGVALIKIGFTAFERALESRRKA